MAGHRGRDVPIRIGDGGDPEPFATVAGIRAKTIALITGLVNTIAADGAEASRVMIAGAGTRRCEASGEGAFKDAASDARMRTVHLGGAAVSLEPVLPDFGVLSGRQAGP